jgi:hypothetical protein
VISEAQKNDRIISRSINHTELLWPIIKKELELSKNKSKHFLKNRLHDSYKSTVHIPSIQCFFQRKYE